MFEMGSPAWGIAVRTILVYLAVFVGLRLMGKRELGQMTVFDLVVILLIANAVQNAMVGPDASLQGGLLAAAVLLVANRALAGVRIRFGRWGRLIEGSPTVLVQDGHYVEPKLRKEGIEPEEVEEAMREHGIDSIESVKLAVLEVDGSISIVPADSRVLRSKKRVRQLKKH
jgi:uncharacterized membrane protein YcaP (DUF421 family)